MSKIAWFYQMYARTFRANATNFTHDKTNTLKL